MRAGTWFRYARQLFGAAFFFALLAGAVALLNAQGHFPGNDAGFMSGMLGDMVGFALAGVAIVFALASIGCGARGMFLRRRHPGRKDLIPSRR